MAVDTAKRNKRQDEWKKANKDRINFVMPKGTKERIQEGAQVLGISSSEFIRQAIEEKLLKIPVNP
jgi:predicted DNA-binding protein